METLLSALDQVGTSEFDALPIWERHRILGEAFDDFKKQVPYDELANPDTQHALSTLKQEVLKTGGAPKDAFEYLGPELATSARVIGQEAIHAIPKGLETIGTALTGRPQKFLQKPVLPQLASEAEVGSRPLESFTGSAVGLAPLSLAAGPVAALATKAGTVGRVGANIAKTIAPLIPAKSVPASLGQVAVFGAESARANAINAGTEATPEQVAGGALKGVLFGGGVLGVSKLIGAGAKAFFKNRTTKLQEPNIKEVDNTINQAKEVARGNDKGVKAVNEDEVTKLAERLKKKGGEGIPSTGPILTITTNPIQKAANTVMEGAKVIGAETIHQPLRVLKRELPEVETLVREGNARATLLNGIEKQYIPAIAKIPVTREEKFAIADVVDNIKTRDILSGKAGDPNLTPAKHFDPQEAKRASDVWSHMTDDVKARTILLVEALRNTAINSGMEEEEMLPSYLPYREELNQWLLQNHPNYKSTNKPSFRYFRSDDSEPGILDPDELLLRYFSESKRDILRNTVKSKLFQASKQAAIDANRPELTSALDQVEHQLTVLHNPTKLDRWLGKGVRSVVEQTIKGNISAGLSNTTQPFNFLYGYIGPKTANEAVSILWDPRIKWVIDKLNLRKTGGAKYDLQKSVMEKEHELNTQKAMQQYAKDADEKVLVDAFQSPEIYLNQRGAVVGGMIQKAGSREVLLNTLGDLQKSEASRGYLLPEESQTLTSLVASGQEVNEATNFVPVEGNRSPYETMQLARIVLPLMRFPLKEGGFVADVLWDSVTAPTMQERLAATRALTTYLGVKGLIVGGGGLATLFIPSAFASMFQELYPEEYKKWEGVVEKLDENTNLPERLGGFDYRQQHSLTDFTRAFAEGKPGEALNIGGNTFIGRTMRNVGSTLPQLLDPDIRKKAKGISTLFRLAPIPNIPLGKFSIGLGGGQLGEVVQAIANTATGTRKVGSHEFPTTAGEELKRLIGPLAKDTAVYDEPFNKKTALRYLKKGVQPSEAVIKELVKAKTGGKGETGLAELNLLDSLGSTAKEKIKEEYYKAFKKEDTEKMMQKYEELLNFGLTPQEIKRFLTGQLKKESGVESPQAFHNKVKRVAALQGGLK